MRVASIIVLVTLLAVVGAGPAAIDQPTTAWAQPLAAAASQQVTTYVVQPGDCLYLIAQRFGTTIRAIAEANGIANANLIYAGQQLAIPATGGSQSQPAPSPAQPAQNEESLVAGSAPSPPVAAQASLPASAAVLPPAVTMSERETALFEAVNGQRIAAGLPALQFEPALVSVARARSSDMAARNYFSHTTPEGGTVQDLLAAAGLQYTWANEILARTNYPDDQSVSVSINAFMNSPAHRGHVLHSAYYRGAVGEARSADGMKYFTVMLASAN